MIAKQVAMRSIRKSDFGDLVRYITESQGSAERIGQVVVTNCTSDNPVDAALEVQLTQQENTRSRADKTYHLIVSFRPGEQPSAEVLRVIEHRICKGLGFGDHQRVSAAHHDTDNVHLHIAINKVHSTRHTVHAPYNDYKILGKLCEALEQEFGLQVDNHAAQKRGAEHRAADMERHAGVESLIGWVQRECLDRMNSASSWAELHQTLHEYGLELRERGNGFVIADGAGTQAKASSIARSLSKLQLEKRLGPVEPSRDRPIGPQSGSGTRYAKKPVRSKIDTTELYARYEQERQGNSAARTAETAVLWQRQVAQIDAIKGMSRLKRSAIKLLSGNRLEKKLLFALASRALKTDLAKAHEQHHRERQWLKQQYPRRVWADWLKAKATQGDEAALMALRARESYHRLIGNTIAATGPKAMVHGLEATRASVTKKGTVIYLSGNAAIRDDGDRLQVSRGADKGGINAALRMAVQRYGNRIAIAGSDEFKSHVAAAAAAAALPITFCDEALERRRQKFSEAIKNGAVYDKQVRRPTHAGGDAVAQPRVADRDSAESDGAVRTSRASHAGHRAERSKPHIGRVGTQPPPEAKNCLRNLSELGVVQLANGSEVLLPRDVPRNLEQPDAPSTHALRRALSEPGRVAEIDVAMAKFIAEREEKRLNGFDIKKHYRYTGVMDSVATYAGTRSSDGHFLTLFERGEGVEILPIDPATARKLKRVALGGVVTITAQGNVKTKGRSR